MVEAPQRTRSLLILAGMIWGTSFVAGKLGVEGTDPYLFSAMRALISSVSILPVFFLYKFDYSLFKSKAVWGIAFLNALGMLLQNVGLTYTTASNTVLLVDINVVIVAVMAAAPAGQDEGGGALPDRTPLAVACLLAALTLAVFWLGIYPAPLLGIIENMHLTAL